MICDLLICYYNSQSSRNPFDASFIIGRPGIFNFNSWQELLSDSSASVSQFTSTVLFRVVDLHICISDLAGVFISVNFRECNKSLYDAFLRDIYYGVNNSIVVVNRLDSSLSFRKIEKTLIRLHVIMYK